MSNFLSSANAIMSPGFSQYSMGSLAGQVAGSGFGPVGSILGSYAGNLLSGALGSGLSYKAAKNLMGKQQAWLEHMSNTAYQRQVKDLVAAGINPLYGLSSGASTPSAGLASAPDFAGALNTGVSLAQQKQMNKAQIDNMEKLGNSYIAQTGKTLAETTNIEKQNERYDEIVQAELDLKAGQLYAALQSGSASSAQASYIRSQQLAQDVVNTALPMAKGNERAFYEFLERNPWLQKAGFVLRSLNNPSIGAKFSGSSNYYHSNFTK